MVTRTNPHYNAPQNMLAPVALASGAQVRGTLDLTDTIGALVKVGILKAAATQPQYAITWKLRRVMKGGLAIPGGPNFPALVNPSSTITGTVANTTVSGTGAAGASTLPVTATANIAAGAKVAIFDAAYARLEVHVVQSIITDTSITLDSPLMYAHTAAQADAVTSLAETWGPVWMEGGDLYDVVFNYPAGTGSNQIVFAIAQVAPWTVAELVTP